MANISEEDNKKIEEYKKKWAEANAAGDTAGMAAAHQGAEAIRAGYGFSGGADGSQNISTGGEWIGGGSKASRNEVDSYGTYKEDLERLTKAQKKYQVAELKKARETALNSLKAQEQEIKPTYQNARNMTSAASQSGARSFAEYLANRGLTNSGAAAQGEMNRLSALQNNLGNINTAEANALRDVANQRTQVESDYANGIASANAAIQQQYLQNLLNYNEQQRQYLDNLRTQALGQYSGDYMAYMNTLDPNSLEYLKAAAARGNKVNALTNAQLANANNLVSNGIINYNTAAGAGMSVPEAQALYARQQEQAQAQAAWDRYVAQTQLENATRLNNANIANKNASTANYYDQINKRGTTSESNYIPKASQESYIKDTFAIKDDFGDVIGYDKDAILEYVKAENLANRIKDDDVRPILYDFGMKEIADKL